MKQHSIHTERIKHIAERLGPLRSKVVFLGGSATGFHITDKDEFSLEAFLQKASKLEFTFCDFKMDRNMNDFKME